MAAKAEDPTLDPPPHHQLTATSLDDNLKDPKLIKKRQQSAAEKEDDEKREPKRRRAGWKLVVDKVTADSPEAEEKKCSFSFDTRLAPAVETTPKFGSFNSAVDLGLGLEDNCEDKEEKEGGEDRE